MPPTVALQVSLYCAVLASGCSAAKPTTTTSPPPVAEPITVSSTDVQVHGCVRIDGAPALQASLETGLTMAKAEPIPLDATGCFSFTRPVGAVRGLEATAPGRGRVVQALLPIAGMIELELSLPPAGATAAAEIRSQDLASRLADITGWYMTTLRGQPSSAHLEMVAARHSAEADPNVRATYGLVYIALARTPGAPVEAIDAARVREALAALDPTHIAWSVEMEAIVLAAGAGDVDPTYLERMLAGHRDPQVYGAAAYVLASTRTAANDLIGVSAALASLRARGEPSVFGRLALTLDPGDLLAQGQPLPPFVLHRSDRPGQLGSADLRGKVFVLHFWATWCQPCLTQIPLLAALRDRHAAEGFEIVSIATDEAAQTVADYRRDHPMPWIHAWEPPAVAEALRQTYQVKDSSKTIIVDRQGIVVAEDLAPKDPEFAAKVAAALARR
ncbi:MAG: TlpA family protein disulfide reductase [Nannocystis sp.]|nr:TlpA disulfide reductase family protein [Nannocystis sp.]MBA3548013.1 TlpA family protein disulfide reductase [Nannocystis sp.]